MDMPLPINVPGNETIMDQSELINVAGPASWGGSYSHREVLGLETAGPMLGSGCQECRGHRAPRGLGCLEMCRETA